MAITKDFKQTVQARALSDPEYRKGLLTESISLMLEGDLETGKSVLRTYIKATIGFEKLAILTGKSAKSLMRMLSPGGNPTAKNLFSMLKILQHLEEITLSVQAVNYRSEEMEHKASMN